MNPFFQTLTPGTPAGISTLVLALRDTLTALGFTPRQCYSAELVTEELGADIIKNTQTAELSLTVSGNNEQILFIVRYGGCNYDPIKNAAPVDLLSGLGDRRSRGVGIRLVRAAAEYTLHDYIEGINVLTLALKKMS